MKSKLSAALDDEATDEEIATLCNALRVSRELQSDAATYTLIGDCLRGEAAATLFVNMTPRVVGAIERENVVLTRADRGCAPYLFNKRVVWGLAASIAGVLVVYGGLLSSDATDTAASRFLFTSVPLERVAPPSTLSQRRGEEPALRESDIREYLIAHQTHSRGVYLGADSQQIRTVSLLDGSAK